MMACLTQLLATQTAGGFADLSSETNADAGYDEAVNAGRHDLSNMDTLLAGFHQESTVTD